MIEQIDYVAYRKLKDISLNFSPYVNLIAGTNGTCKTSILHTISNSFKAVVSTAPWLNDDKATLVIKNINKLCNPKIETLTRGDREFNNPGQGVTGTLFKANYFDETSLSFRKHNSSKTNNTMRFAIKPQYKVGESESLPALPTIYLGLFRLFAYGEFESDHLVRDISSRLPVEYLTIITDLYRDFTGLTIELEDIKSMGNIKNRPEFKTSISGIDSNTISAGEDNLFIILLALVSLRYYFESITSERLVESIFLIDEIDASLHPEFQLKLFNLFTEYSREYKIQVFFTTHSMTLIDHALSKKNECKTTYLIDNIDRVNAMIEPDKYKIDMFLKNITQQEHYLYNKIPVITEDAEARLFLNLLLENHPSNIQRFFHIVEANLPSEAILNLANDDFLLKSTLRTVNMLDGDQHNKKDLNKNIITLPSNLPPEVLAFSHARKLLEQHNHEFWNNQVLINQGLTKIYFSRNILPDLDKIQRDYDQLKEERKPTKGFLRERNKKIFNKHLLFWKYVLLDWTKSNENNRQINQFYDNLRIVFLKTAEFHGLSSNEWNE